MGEQWKEVYLLKLVDAVSKVEGKRKWNEFIRNSEVRVIWEKESKWDQVAAKIPLSAFVELNDHRPTRYKDFPDICRRKFIEICEYFNNVFIKSDRNVCLTRTLMTKLAEYSKSFPDQPCFFKTGPQAKLIKIDHDSAEPLAASASAIGVDCSSRIRDSSGKVCEHLSTPLDQQNPGIYRSLGRQYEAHEEVDTTLSEVGSREVSSFSTCLVEHNFSLHRGSGRRKSNAQGDSLLEQSEQSRLDSSRKRSEHLSTPLDQQNPGIYKSSGRQYEANEEVDTTLGLGSCEVSSFSTSCLVEHNLGLRRGSGRQKSNAQGDRPLERRQQGRLDDSNFKFKDVEFEKKMTHSHVVSGFLLHVPKDFCTANLAQYRQEKGVPFVLVDEDLVRWKVTYLPNKRSLSAGWGTFAKKHALKKDDIVRFRLLKEKTFQVTIIEEAEEFEAG